MKYFEKEKAIAMREEGHSLSEILEKVTVAKSTLCLWLKEAKLSEPQYQMFTAKRLEALRRGGRAKREQKIQKIKKIFEECAKDINSISKRELWLIGVVLYWAEGAKEKDYAPGSGIKFGNSDPRMIRLFLKWLTDQKVTRDRIGFEIYIHKESFHNIDYVRDYWSKHTGFPITSFQKVYYKKHRLSTNRRNVSSLYYGGLRVKVSASSDLQRRIAGWTESIIKHIG